MATVYAPFEEGKPDPATQNGLNAFDSTRENMEALRDAVVMGTMSGWNLAVSGGTAEAPTQYLYTLGTQRVRATLTWGTSGGADGNVEKVKYEYSSDGSTWDDMGSATNPTYSTVTISYDADSNVTGTGWAAT